MHKKFNSFTGLCRALLDLECNKPYDTITFDIFDTLIHRRMAPEAVIDGVAHHLKSLMTSKGVATVPDLLRARNDAYHEVASHYIKQGLDLDLTLDKLAPAWVRHAAADDIPGELFDQIATEIIAVEVEYEQRVCYPNPWMRTVLPELKARGFKLFCISDMYLGRKYVEFLLNAGGFNDYFSDIYVSSDVNLLKRTGRLFSFVKDKEFLTVDNWLHIGDNFLADGRMPKKMGISSWLINDRSLHGAYRLQRYDYRLYSQDKTWAGVVAATYAQAQPDELITDVEAYSRRVFGPVYASFVHRVLERCRDENVGRVFFFAREGQLLKHLYNELARSVYPDGGQPRPVYLGISRLTVFIASLHGYGLRHITAALANTGNYTLKNLFAPLQIEEENLRAIACRNSIQDIDAPLPPGFLHWSPLHHFLDDPDLKNYIEDRSRDMRVLLLDYLREVGFFDYDKVAVVDVGWSGQIQDNLFSVIRSEPKFPIIIGMYIGATALASEKSCDYSRIEALIADQSESEWCGNSIFEFVFAYEAASRAPHGTTIGYRRECSDGVFRVTPEFRSNRAPSRITEVQDDQFIALLQSGIRQYGERYAECAVILGYSAGSTIPYARNMIERAVRYPEKSEAQWWLSVKNVSDLGSEEVFCLGDGLRSRKIYLLFNCVSLLKKVFWRYALLAVVGGRVMQLAFAIANSWRGRRSIGAGVGNRRLIEGDANNALSVVRGSGGTDNSIPEQSFEPDIELIYQTNVAYGRLGRQMASAFCSTEPLKAKELLLQIIGYKTFSILMRITRRGHISYGGVRLKWLAMREIYSKYEIDRWICLLKDSPVLRYVSRIIRR